MVPSLADGDPSGLSHDPLDVFAGAADVEDRVVVVKVDRQVPVEEVRGVRLRLGEAYADVVANERGSVHAGCGGAALELGDLFFGDPGLDLGADRGAADLCAGLGHFMPPGFRYLKL